MDQHGHAQLAGLVPDGCQIGFVHGDQVALVIAVMQAQLLEHFQAPRPQADMIS